MGDIELEIVGEGDEEASLLRIEDLCKTEAAVDNVATEIHNFAALVKVSIDEQCKDLKYKKGTTVSIDPKKLKLGHHVIIDKGNHSHHAIVVGQSQCNLNKLYLIEFRCDVDGNDSGCSSCCSSKTVALKLEELSDYQNLVRKVNYPKCLQPEITLVKASRLIQQDNTLRFFAGETSEHLATWCKTSNWSGEIVGKINWGDGKNKKCPDLDLCNAICTGYILYYSLNRKMSSSKVKLILGAIKFLLSFTAYKLDIFVDLTGDMNAGAWAGCNIIIAEVLVFVSEMAYLYYNIYKQQKSEEKAQNENESIHYDVIHTNTSKAKRLTCCNFCNRLLELFITLIICYSCTILAYFVAEWSNWPTCDLTECRINWWLSLWLVLIYGLGTFLSKGVWNLYLKCCRKCCIDCCCCTRNPWP